MCDARRNTPRREQRKHPEQQWPNFYRSNPCKDVCNIQPCALRQAGVSCSGTEGEFRVTDIRPEATPDLESGILEVFHAGAWGTVCSGNFGFLDVCSHNWKGPRLDC